MMSANKCSTVEAEYLVTAACLYVCGGVCVCVCGGGGGNEFSQLTHNSESLVKCHVCSWGGGLQYKPTNRAVKA